MQGEDLIVKARVKEAVTDKAVSEDFYDELGKRVEEILYEAERRADQNHRGTVMPRDL